MALVCKHGCCSASTLHQKLILNMFCHTSGATGKVLRHWGAGMLHLPHMITVDKNSSVYIADAGLHQVLKFSASGQLLLTAGLFDQPGHRLVAAPPYGMLDQPGRMTVKLCQPTDVSAGLWLCCVASKASSDSLML